MTITINKKEYPLHTLDTGAQELSKKRWDSIAKPLHSLGKMEDLVIQTAGITGDANVTYDKKALIVMCADNGVVAEGVTQSEQLLRFCVSRQVQRFSRLISELQWIRSWRIIRLPMEQKIWQKNRP